MRTRRGVARPFRRGDLFDCSYQPVADWIDITNVKENGQRVRKETLHRLLRLIHEQGF